MAYDPCPNCKGTISCSCQYQTAKNGAICCDDCIENYNLALDLAEAIVHNHVPKVEENKPEEDEPDNQLPE